MASYGCSKQLKREALKAASNFGEEAVVLAEAASSDILMDSAVAEVGSLTVKISWPPKARCFEFDLGASWLAGRSSIRANSLDFKVLLMDSSVADWRPDLHWVKLFEKSPLNHALRPGAGIQILLDEASGVISALDWGKMIAACWVHDAKELPYWFAATPFRSVFSWVAARSGGELIHGAAVDTKRGCILLAGPGGSGKSTLTLAAAATGFRILGDDFVLLNQGFAKALYSRIKCYDTTLSVLESAGISTSEVGEVLNPRAKDQKLIIQVNDMVMEHQARPVKAVFLPVVGSRFMVERVSPGDAFRAISVPTLEGLMGGTGSTLTAIRQLVEAVPCYRVEVGSDPALAIQTLVSLTETGLQS